jgi:hypothetical protein
MLWSGFRGGEVVLELLVAALNGDVAEVQRLATLGADVNVENAHGARPLYHALS